MSRRRARERALQLLFQLDSRPAEIDWQIEDFCQAEQAGMHVSESLPEVQEADAKVGDILTAEDMQWLEAVVRYTWAERLNLDQLIQARLHGWRLERLPRVERAILRLSLAELHMRESPDNTIVMEAVLLARRYASEEARRYINAVLGTYLRSVGRGTKEAPQTEVPQQGETSADLPSDTAADMKEDESSSDSDSPIGLSSQQGLS